MNALFAIGLGARRGASAEEIVALVREAAAQADVDPKRCALFTLEAKQAEAGMHEAARLLRTRIVFLPLAALRARQDDVLTRSPRVEATIGLPSVAETAALAGAGQGSRLLAPRIATKRLTCAIARARAHEESVTPMKAPSP